jgi:hypothetical protein
MVDRYEYRDVDEDITIVGGRADGSFIVLLYPEEKLGVIQAIEREAMTVL